MRNLMLAKSLASPTMALSVLVMAGANGCAMPLEEGHLDQAELEASASKEQSIQNGEVRPSEMSGGTVRITIEGALDPRGEPFPSEGCSGQVISRDSILLAAHCFFDSGYYIDGWQKSVTVKAYVQHQRPGAFWESLSSSEETMKVYVPSAYFLYENDDSLKIGVDVAVLRRTGGWWNTRSTDVTALATDQADRPAALYLYGYGYYSDTQIDYRARRGLFDTLIYYPNNAFTYPGSIKYTPVAGDPYSCSGDSGGPWKVLQTAGPTVSGVQFGVHSSGITAADGHCTEDGSRAAMVARNVQWIKARVEEGFGSCSDTVHTVRPPNRASKVVDTITCW